MGAVLHPTLATPAPEFENPSWFSAIVYATVRASVIGKSRKVNPCWSSNQRRKTGERLPISEPSPKHFQVSGRNMLIASAVPDPAPARLRKGREPAGSMKSIESQDC